MTDDRSTTDILDLNNAELNLSDLNLDDVKIVSEDDSYALAEGGASYSPKSSCSIVVTK